MATLDRESDQVVVRIVYDGPPTSGKTTSLRTLAARFGQRPVFTPEESSGRTLFFDWMEFVGGRFEGRQIRCQIVSVPGQAELSHRRQLLLSSADAVVFVADTTKQGLPESVLHLEDLQSRLRAANGFAVGVVLQANKRDLPDAQPLDSLRDRGLAIIESVASEGEGIREAFVFAVRLALDRVREQMSQGQLQSVPPSADPAGELLKVMRALPIDPRAEKLWPSRGPVESPHRSPTDRAPRLPDAAIPGGWIWPPINGRILLKDATTNSIPPARELSAGEWLAESEGGWRFHTSSQGVFTDAEKGRAALIRWAQLHSSVTGWVSTSRCIALCEAGDGTYRLWQVVRQEPSLRTRAQEVLAGRDGPQRHTALMEASALCSRAAQRWTGAPVDLPCSLETVGMIDGAVCFVGLMPDLEKVRSSIPVDLEETLSDQLEALIRTERGPARAS